MTEQLIQQDSETSAQRLRITGLMTQLDEEKRESATLRDGTQQLARELEENTCRLGELEKLIESRGKKLNIYKRTQQAERVHQQQAAEAQREMRGEFEGQLDRFRDQLATERRRSVELSCALEVSLILILTVDQCMAC